MITSRFPRPRSRSWSPQLRSESTVRHDESVARQVVFIQGGGKGVHDQWDNKLVDSLRRELGPEYDVRYPRMPNEADPSCTSWKAAPAKEIADLDDDGALIGHSVGGTILINALAETPPN